MNASSPCLAGAVKGGQPYLSFPHLNFCPGWATRNAARAVCTNGRVEPYQIDKIVFTVQNYTAEDEYWVKELHGLQSLFSYLVVGYEFAPSTGTPHLQCFGVLNKKMTRPVIAEWFQDVVGIKPFFEKAWGDSATAATYCKKGGDFVEFGDHRISRGEAGKEVEKRRWNGINDAMQAATNESEYMEWLMENLSENDFQRNLDKYLNTYRKWHRMFNKPRILKPEELTCEWIMGPSGCGKSRAMHEENPGMYPKMNTGKWMDDFNGESCVGIDDVDERNVQYLGEFIKNLADIYPFRAEVKGSSMLMRPTKVVITSQYSIAHIFGRDPSMVAALNRRFTVRKFPIVTPTADPPVEDLTRDEEEDDAREEVAVTEAVVPPAAFW